MLTVGSLFSGIGGLDLGLERAGMNVIWQSEIDPYASRVLQKHWPEVPNHGDIKTINWGDIVRPNVLCGGYPCQPFSTAGKRKGEEDPRHLWPWVREAISELRPDYVVLENVRGHLSLGGTTVIGEITALGYDAEWRVVSAASVGANHKRDRIFIVAYPNNTRSGTPQSGVDTNGQTQEQEWQNKPQSWISRLSSNVADTHGRRQQECKPETESATGISISRQQLADTEGGTVRGAESHDLSTVYGQTAKLGKQNCSTRSIAHWWQVEPDVGRVANGVPARVDRLRGLGNAVVPQVAEIIGRLVVAHAQNN